MFWFIHNALIAQFLCIKKQRNCGKIVKNRSFQVPNGRHTRLATEHKAAKEQVFLCGPGGDQKRGKI